MVGEKGLSEDIADRIGAYVKPDGVYGSRRDGTYLFNWSRSDHINIFPIEVKEEDDGWGGLDLRLVTTPFGIDVFVWGESLSFSSRLPLTTQSSPTHSIDSGMHPALIANLTVQDLKNDAILCGNKSAQEGVWHCASKTIFSHLSRVAFPSLLYLSISCYLLSLTKESTTWRSCCTIVTFLASSTM